MGYVKTLRQRACEWSVLVPLLCSGLLTLGPLSAWAVDNEESRATLRGVMALEVGVGEVLPAMVRAGLTQETIRREVEQHLRHAGLALLTREALLQHPDAAFFAVSVGAARHPAGQLYAYAIDVSVYQTATLARNTAITLSLPTWSSGSFGIVGATNLRDLLPRIRERVAQFVKAHRLVHPRKGGQRLTPAQSVSPSRPKAARERPRTQTPTPASRTTRSEAPHRP